MKRLTCMVLILLLLCGVSGAAWAASFTDSAGHWAEEAIELWAAAGVLQGEDGQFRPNDPVTRAELAAIISRVCRYTETAANRFTDLTSANWYFEDVLKLEAAGVLAAENSRFAGAENATRETAFVWLGRAFGVAENVAAAMEFSDGSRITSAARGYVGGMAAAGYVQGYNGQIQPQEPITRAEIATILTNVYPFGFQDEMRAVPVETAAGLNLAQLSRTTGVRLPYAGYYVKTITVGETNRSIKYYIPQGHELQGYLVLLTVPEGVASTEAFLAQSGWLTLAEEHDFALTVLEPGPDGWGTPDEEAAYVAAAYDARNVTLAVSTYVAGYGPAGTALHKLVMNNAIEIAAAAFIDASEIGADYLASRADSFYPYDEGLPSDVAYTDVPLPVFIIDRAADSAEVQAVARYWRDVNGTGVRSRSFLNYGTIYYQDEANLSRFTPYGAVAHVAVLPRTESPADAALSRSIYEEFLGQTTRYGGVAYSNVLAPRADYAALGVEFYELEVDGWLRQLMVYVPQSAKRSAAEVPVVYVLPGMNQSSRGMFDITRWWEVAEENAFIVVSLASRIVNEEPDFKPTDPITTNWDAATPRADNVDAHFIEAAIALIEENYHAAANRRYLTGQSMGCRMSQYLAAVMPETFAAVGATSLPFADHTLAEAAGWDARVLVMMGQYDLFTVTGNNGAAPEAESAQMILGTLGLHGLSFPTGGLSYEIGREYTEAELREMLAAALRAARRAQAGDDGMFTVYTWDDADGNPAFRYVETALRGHSLLPSECRYLWDHWFSHWLLEDGAPYYMDF